MNAPIDISNVILKTDRLILRAWQARDLEDFYEYASVDGVGQMAGWLPHANREESLRILNMFIEGKKTFALEHMGKVIGSLGIEEYKEERFPEFDALRCREIGYALSKAYWGRGLMPEAVMAALGFLFEDIKLDAVLCGYFAWNAQSKRVQEKCGFTGYARYEYETSMGKIEDTYVNLLTREQWLRGRKKA